MRLGSYVQGRWIEGTGAGVELRDPSTEEVIGTASTEGLDLGAALEHARARGGPALRAMSFSERGALVKAMSKVLHAHRDELLDLETRCGGNTRGDGKFDVDGGIGTLAWYAGLGKRLGDGRLLLDGDWEQLGRTPRFFGHHVLVPRRGAAVLINAFNFPIWGFAEKAACALLAGVPVVCKPATSTALVAVRAYERLVEAGVVPDGVLSLISGPAGDLLDHLAPQDVVAFTGSSATGAAIRSHASVIALGVPVNVEADSVNAAVLDPSVDASSDLYDIFLGDVVRDMTQKAGQKCTAIRRVLVPADRVSEVGEDLDDLLGGITVGNPAERGVRMGPVASARQLRDVQAGIDRLSAHARRLAGGEAPESRPGVAAGRGYFVDPLVLAAADPRAATLHETEVFGPVATVIPYDGTAAQAASLVALGGGGLVMSAYSEDRDFLETLVYEAAPHHGRLYFGSARTAEDSMGPGAVLPQLVHGGPGRAGGGEELGGERGLHGFMQRTAVQGYRPLLEKVLSE